MIIVQATNIHQGGGAVLLTALLDQISQTNEKAILFVDERFSLPERANIEVFKVKPKIISRLWAEWKLKQTASLCGNPNILFLGNLPPLFKNNSRSILFFQNTVLLDQNRHFDFNFSVRFKHAIERMWLKSKLGNISLVIVQSGSLERSLNLQFPKCLVKVVPFAEFKSYPPQVPKSHDFIYVASSDPHKNHLNLLKAWLLLGESGVVPKLTLTASNFSIREQNLLEAAAKNKLNIELVPNLPHDEVLKMYSSAKALIYPSFTESFGLPLVEAKIAGLPIIASELDYVRDIVSPAQTFDPNSEISIARAVLRFLNLPEIRKVEIKSAAEFLNEVLANAKLQS